MPPQLTNASFLNSPFLFVIPVSLTKRLPHLYLGYPHCRVTFLETPVYSIYGHSKYQGQTDSEFKKLDNELLSQINELNQNSREIKTGLNNISPVLTTIKEMI
jgi:hypothetical protein